jgi:hypothetical protein
MLLLLSRMKPRLPCRPTHNRNPACHCTIKGAMAGVHIYKFLFRQLHHLKTAISP